MKQKCKVKFGLTIKQEDILFLCFRILGTPNLWNKPDSKKITIKHKENGHRVIKFFHYFPETICLFPDGKIYQLEDVHASQISAMYLSRRSSWEWN